jgi:hypothetical protein
VHCVGHHFLRRPRATRAACRRTASAAWLRTNIARVPCHHALLRCPRSAGQRTLPDDVQRSVQSKHCRFTQPCYPPWQPQQARRPRLPASAGRRSMGTRLSFAARKSPPSRCTAPCAGAGQHARARARDAGAHRVKNCPARPTKMKAILYLRRAWRKKASQQWSTVRCTDAPGAREASVA